MTIGSGCGHRRRRKRMPARRGAVHEHIHRKRLRHFAARLVNPHCYSHIRTWSDPAHFDWTVAHIELLGSREKFPEGPGGRYYDVLNRVHVPGGTEFKVLVHAPPGLAQDSNQ